MDVGIVIVVGGNVVAFTSVPEDSVVVVIVVVVVGSVVVDVSPLITAPRQSTRKNGTKRATNRNMVRQIDTRRLKTRRDFTLFKLYIIDMPT